MKNSSKTPFKKPKKNFLKSEEKKEIIKAIESKIFTKEDLIVFLEELSLIQNFIFQQNISRILKEKLTPLGFWLVEKLLSYPPEQRNVIISFLKEHFSKRPIAIITLAFSPTSNILKKISDWFLSHTKEKVILDIKIAPEILGGLIIEFKGKYLNLSLQKQIDKFLL